VIDIGGPVRGEVFVVTEEYGRILLTGPDGPQAWHIEVHGRSNPMQEIEETISRLLPSLVLLHSTSWRWEESAVVLTFIAVVAASSDSVTRHISTAGVALARGSATEAPTEIAERQVLEHALRHLAWLVREDEVVRAELSDSWREALADFVPATFQQLG
jgi:hypothetical protein